MLHIFIRTDAYTKKSGIGTFYTLIHCITSEAYVTVELNDNFCKITNNIPYLKFLQLISAIVSNLKVFSKSNKRTSLPHIFISLKKNLRKFLITFFFWKICSQWQNLWYNSINHIFHCVFKNAYNGLKLFLREQFYFSASIFSRDISSIFLL